MKQFAISYGYIGETFRTVFRGDTASDAEAKFKRLNPHVEFLSIEDPPGPDPDAPPVNCGHGPDSCPKMSVRGFCGARRCIYGLKANNTLTGPKQPGKESP